MSSPLIKQYQHWTNTATSNRSQSVNEQKDEDTKGDRMWHGLHCGQFRLLGGDRMWSSVNASLPRGNGTWQTGLRESHTGGGWQDSLSSIQSSDAVNWTRKGTWLVEMLYHLSATVKEGNQRGHLVYRGSWIVSGYNEYLSWAEWCTWGKCTRWHQFSAVEHVELVPTTGQTMLRDRHAPGLQRTQNVPSPEHSNTDQHSDNLQGDSK